MTQTDKGNTIIPNSYQTPNYFVDVLMPLLPPSANIVLQATCRKILGWEKSRLTHSDRISLSQFMLLTGFSRSTVTKALGILESAHILIPIGDPNSQGQEYLLNLGDRGPYDLDYLNQLDYRPGNPDPIEATAAATAKRQSGSPLNGLVHSLDQSIGLQKTSPLNEPLPVHSMDTQKKENQKGEFSNPILLKALEDLARETNRFAMDYLREHIIGFEILGNDCFIVISNEQSKQWIENRLGEKLRSAFLRLEGNPNVYFQTTE